MNEIGFYGRADTITPAHEHFIQLLNKAKLLINTTKKTTSIEPTKYR
jgi:hypothetical protein